MADSLENAVETLRGKGVRLWVENGALRYRAPKGAITEEDIAVLQRADSKRLSVLVAQRDGTLFQPSFVEEWRSTRAPLSFNQLAHWQLCATSGYRPVRQVTSFTRLHGVSYESAIKDAFSIVAERHDGLRTNIISHNGEIAQRVLPKVNSSIRVVDMTDVLPSELDKEISRQIACAVTDVSDYSVDDLSTLVLLRLDKAEAVLILAMDHMVSDGTSTSIVSRELITAYEQLVGGHEVSLPTVRMQYPDYAIWQRTKLTDYLMAQQSMSSVWRRTRFPTDVRDQGGKGWGQVRFTVNSRVRMKLEELARYRGTTLVIAVLTAYLALVTRWCEVDNTIVQVISDGRTSRIIENTVGYFAYPVYLRVSIAQSDTFEEMLGFVTKEYCRACARPDYYYSYTMSPCPEFTRNTSFNWRPKSRELEDVHFVGSNEYKMHPRIIFDDPSLDDLNIDAEPGVGFQDLGNEIAGFVTFPRSRFTLSTMTAFATALGLFFDAMAASPGTCIREVATVR